MNGYKAINKPEIVCKVGKINLSYECLTSPEIRQALVGLRNTDSALFEKVFQVPTLLDTVPPLSLERGGSYPEDQEREDNGGFVDSSLSIDEVVAHVADDRLGELADSSGDEDDGIDGFCEEYFHGPACPLIEAI